MVVYSISVINDCALRHSRVLPSDDLRNTYGSTPVLGSTVSWLLVCAKKSLLSRGSASMYSFASILLCREGYPCSSTRCCQARSAASEKALGRPITKFSAEVDAPVQAPPDTLSAATSLRLEAAVATHTTAPKRPGSPVVVQVAPKGAIETQTPPPYRYVP